MALPVKSIEELQERVNTYARPRHADSSVSSDGVRLDSKEKMLDFLAVLAQERAAIQRQG